MPAAASRLPSPATFAVALALAACTSPGRPPGAKDPGRSPPVELAADPALLAKLPLAVAEVLVGDPETAQHAGPVRSALRRTAAREGFAATSLDPAPGDLVLKASYDWTPLGRAADPRLFLTLALEHDGERIDEVYLQQAEGFPQSEPELDALVGKLVRQLARSPRTQGWLRDAGR